MGMGMAFWLTLRCLGLAPTVEEGVEFRFVGREREVWRGSGRRPDFWLGSAASWVRVASGSGWREAWMGNRVALRLRGDSGGERARQEGARLGLRWSRTGAGDIQIFQARDPWTAARASAEGAALPGIEVATPILRRPLALHARYASRPNDPFFPDQWHLENRDVAERSIGPDLHVRSAWGVVQGEGVTVAICDDGYEADHPDLR